MLASAWWNSFTGAVRETFNRKYGNEEDQPSEGH